MPNKFFDRDHHHHVGKDGETPDGCRPGLTAKRALSQGEKRKLVPHRVAF
ncbi:hypothetical protein [Brevibacillus parabrevis]|nr:hypothetical protein [Brevibacillus parabrevis]MED1721372.1 hypothetical protein [Brevibacillus parabrevis]